MTRLVEASCWCTQQESTTFHIGRRVAIETKKSEVQVLVELQENIIEALGSDQTTLNIMKKEREGKIKKCWVEDNLLYFHERIYMLKSAILHRELL